MKIIAVDPGSSGAIATFYKGNLMLTQAMPKTRELIRHMLATEWAWSMKNLRHITFVLERVPKFIPGKNVTGSQMAVLHGNAGFIEGVIHGMTGHPPVFYAPQSWQHTFKKLGLLPAKRHDGDHNTTAWKSALAKVAQDMYPERKIPKYAADAVLIGHHHLTKTLLK